MEMFGKSDLAIAGRYAQLATHRARAPPDLCAHSRRMETTVRHWLALAARRQFASTPARNWRWRFATACPTSIRSIRAGELISGNVPASADERVAAAST